MAGALYRGLPVQRNRGPGTIAAPRIGAGIVSGLILGFVPGVLVAGLSMLADYIDVAYAVDEEHPEEPEKVEAKKNEEPIALEANAKKDNKEPGALEAKPKKDKKESIAPEASARTIVRNQ